MKLVINGGPVSPMYQLYIADATSVIESVSVSMNDLHQAIEEYLYRYEIDEIHLAGPAIYMSQLEKDIIERNIGQYSNKTITFKYI